jgi:hypothetical protein
MQIAEKFENCVVLKREWNNYIEIYITNFFNKTHFLQKINKCKQKLTTTFTATAYKKGTTIFFR